MSQQLVEIAYALSSSLWLSENFRTSGLYLLVDCAEIAMSNGTFTAYAPPLLFGPWTEAISGLGIQANVRLDVSPEGDTTLFGEVRYFNRSGDQVVQSFQGIALIETNEGFQNVEVRFKGVPTGSAVAGTWTT